MVLGCDKPAPQGNKPIVEMQGNKAIITAASAKVPDKRVEEGLQAPTAGIVPDDSRPRIINMKIGESAWIEPWTIWGDREGIWMVNAYHNTVQNPHRDCVRITRVEKGFEANLALSTYRWTRVDLPSKNYEWIGVPITNLVMPE